MDRVVVGLIPAAGHATRLAPLPFSKELYPIGSRRLGDGTERRPKAVCHYLLEKMRLADITRAYLVIREGKWDIPAYLRDGSMLDMHFGYIVVESTAGPPYTLDRAYPFVRDAIVAFGFPDILFDGDDAFRSLLSLQARRDADIVLGLFPGDRPDRMDMVEVDGEGRVTDLVIQPRQTRLEYSWDVAVWTPVFTEFLRRYLTETVGSAAQPPTLSVGHVIQAAIRRGLQTEAVIISNLPYCDIGTPEGLNTAMRRFAFPD